MQDITDRLFDPSPFAGGAIPVADIVGGEPIADQGAGPNTVFGAGTARCGNWAVLTRIIHEQEKWDRHLACLSWMFRGCQAGSLSHDDARKLTRVVPFFAEGSGVLHLISGNLIEWAGNWAHRIVFAGNTLFQTPGLRRRSICSNRSSRLRKEQTVSTCGLSVRGVWDGRRKDTISSSAGGRPFRIARCRLAFHLGVRSIHTADCAQENGSSYAIQI